MKSILVLAAAMLFSISAFAEFCIGDWVRYQTTTINENTGRIEVSHSRITVVDINQLHKSALLKDEKLNEHGNTISTENVWMDFEDLIDKKTATEMIARCETPEVGGVLASVTVLAGTFDVCKTGDEEFYTWIAPVPFGEVKSATEVGWEFPPSLPETYYITSELVAFGEGCN